MVSSSPRQPRPIDRRLIWEGCVNVRDLGGHHSVAGGLTRWGAVVRSEAPERLTNRGWDALRRHGVATIIDLRDPAEYAQASPPPEGIAVVTLPLLDLHDDEFWAEGRWRGIDHSSEFYLAVVERWPERVVAAVTAVARARPGAVLIHCQAGRDRTGLLAAALLVLVGVGHESIARDYSESAACLQPLYDEWIRNAPDEVERERIRHANVSDASAMRTVLGSLDLPARLREHGLADADLIRLRARLLAPPAS